MDTKGFVIAIFLGWLGGYRFYKKQYALGFVYLFTFGLFGIGWLVDIIKASKSVPSPSYKQVYTPATNMVCPNGIPKQQIDLINTKIVGVTFSSTQGKYKSRQEAIKSLTEKDTLRIEYYEFQGKPAYKVIVNSNNTDIGNIKGDLAEKISKKYGQNYKSIVSWEKTGGSGKTYGCNISIGIS